MNLWMKLMNRMGSRKESKLFEKYFIHLTSDSPIGAVTISEMPDIIRERSFFCIETKNDHSFSQWIVDNGKQRRQSMNALARNTAKIPRLIITVPFVKYVSSTSRKKFNTVPRGNFIANESEKETRSTHNVEVRTRDPISSIPSVFFISFYHSLGRTV